MTARMIGLVAISSLAVAAGCTIPVGAPKDASAAEDSQRGLHFVRQKLAALGVPETGEIVPITDESLPRALPGHLFYVLRFRQYPVATAPPKPLGSNNIFVVKADDSVDHIRNTRALETFFRSALARTMAAGQAKDAAQAWLRLSQELHQDGFLQFSIPAGSIAVASTTQSSLKVTAQAVVDPHGGNEGEIVVSLIFDPTGSLVNVSETANIKRGIRPICQATKLLDPDPVVRGMAEQAILVMGKAAKEYLNEQRKTARPELRRAIDAIWQQILAEGR